MNAILQKHMKFFDAHFHIIDFDFPLISNRGYLPSEFTINDYRASTKQYDLEGGAVVSGSFQGFDHSYLIHALEELGPGFVGVANIPIHISREELIRLDKAGVRAVRFNIVRGSSKNWSPIVNLANRLYEDFGWHSELYIQNETLKNFSKVLQELPLFSIDHLGLTKNGLDTLLALVERGVRVKATGFGRLNFNPIEIMKEIYSVNSEALMFGTDLPSTRAARPFSQEDIFLIKNHFSEEQQKHIFYENAIRWYKR